MNYKHVMSTIIPLQAQRHTSYPRVAPRGRLGGERERHLQASYIFDPLLPFEAGAGQVRAAAKDGGGGAVSPWERVRSGLWPAVVFPDAAAPSAARRRLVNIPPPYGGYRPAMGLRGDVPRAWPLQDPDLASAGL